jgi:hypothetical protein
MWIAATVPAAGQRLPLISITNSWKYDAGTNDLGAGWKDFGYDDTGWAGPAPAPFGYENNANIPVRTNTFVPLRTNNIPIIGYYYRTRFVFPTNPANVTLLASNLVDDGAVFWLNGQEAGRLRMTNAVVVRTNVATGTPPGGDATAFEVITLTNHLVEGTNVLAVEVHQNSASSTDTLFAMSLTALIPYAPLLTDPNQPTNRTVEQGRATTLLALADALPAPAYQWFHDGAPVLGATNPAYAIAAMTEADGGDYFCEITNGFGRTNTRTATVVYEPDVTPPTLVYALASINGTNITVSYSEPLDQGTAEDFFNYTILEYGTDAVLLLEQNGVLVNRTNVVLTTGPRAPGAYYRIIVSGVSDAQGIGIADGSVIPVSVVVVAADRQLWKHFQSDGDPGAGWPQPGFNDSVFGWASDPAAFYAKRGTPVGGVPLRTQLSLTNPPGASAITVTYYFRTRFTSFGYVTRLQLRPLVDDGAVLYLNGQEAWRVRLPVAPAPISYTNFANQVVTDPEVVFEGPWDIPATNLVDGENVVAVEVHQANLASSDMYFAAELIATANGQPRPPRLSVEYAGGTVTVSWSGDDFVLMENDDPTNPAGWHDVMDPGPITASPYTRPLPAANRFYALRLGP